MGSRSKRTALQLLVAFFVAFSSAVVVAAPPASATGCWGYECNLSIRDKIVNAASSQVGYQEDANGCSKFGPCGAWCAMFARWAWQQGGATSWYSTNVAEQVATWGKNHNRWKLSAPRPGDIVVWSSGKLDGGIGGHVGVVEYVSNGYIHSIDGNWGNAVTRRSYVNKVGSAYGQQTLQGFVAPPGASLT
jgi:hypothetical protein